VPFTLITNTWWTQEWRVAHVLTAFVFSYTIRFISTSGRNPVVHLSILCSLTQMVSVGKNMTCNSMGVRFDGKNVSEGTVTGIVASYRGLLTTNYSTRRGADAWKRNLNYSSERLFQSNCKISDQKVVAIFVVLAYNYSYLVLGFIGWLYTCFNDVQANLTIQWSMLGQLYCPPSSTRLIQSRTE